jgi:hypothetical protein
MRDSLQLPFPSSYKSIFARGLIKTPADEFSWGFYHNLPSSELWIEKIFYFLKQFEHFAAM